MARRADPLSYARAVAYVYFPAIPAGVLRPDVRAVREIEGALRIAERSGDNFALAFARMTLGVALVHRETAAEYERGERLLNEVTELFQRQGHNLSELPVVNVYSARDRARRGERDDAIVELRAIVDHLVREGQLLTWGIPATAVLVETLLDRGADSDVPKPRRRSPFWPSSATTGNCRCATSGCCGCGPWWPTAPATATSTRNSPTATWSWRWPWGSRATSCGRSRCRDRDPLRGRRTPRGATPATRRFGALRQRPGVAIVLEKRRGMGGIAQHADGGILVSGRDLTYAGPSGSRKTCCGPTGLVSHRTVPGFTCANTRQHGYASSAPRGLGIRPDAARRVRRLAVDAEGGVWLRSEVTAASRVSAPMGRSRRSSTCPVG